MMHYTNPYFLGGLAFVGVSLLTMGNPDRAVVQGIERDGSQAAAHADIELQRAKAEDEIARLRLAGVCVLLAPTDADGHPVSLNTPGLRVPNVRQGVAVCDHTGNTAIVQKGGSLTAFAQARDPQSVALFLSNITEVHP